MRHDDVGEAVQLLAEALQIGIGEVAGGVAQDFAALSKGNHSTIYALFVVRRELFAGQWNARATSAAEASVGGEAAGSGLVVDLAGGSEGLEALARGGGGDAELGGELAQGGGAAVAPAFPPGEQLMGVDSGASHQRVFPFR